MKLRVVWLCLLSSIWAAEVRAEYKPPAFCKDDPQFREYKAVCARTSKNIVATYPNWCYARNDGAKKIDAGWPTKIDSDGNPLPADTEACPQPACDANYAPVCARGIVRYKDEKNKERNDSFAKFEYRVYYNECVATWFQAQPFSEYSKQKLKAISQLDKVEDMLCPKDVDACGSEPTDYVCARKLSDDEKQTPGDIILYRNNCEAVAKGAVFVTKATNGKCPKS